MISYNVHGADASVNFLLVNSMADDGKSSIQQLFFNTAPKYLHSSAADEV